MRVCAQCYQKNNPLKTFIPKDYPLALRYPRPDVLLTVHWTPMQHDVIEVVADEHSVIAAENPASDNVAINVAAPNNPPAIHLEEYFNNYVPPSRGGDMGTPHIKNRRFRF